MTSSPHVLPLLPHQYEGDMSKHVLSLRASAHIFHLPRQVTWLCLTSKETSMVEFKWSREVLSYGELGKRRSGIFVNSSNDHHLCPPSPSGSSFSRLTGRSGWSWQSGPMQNHVNCYQNPWLLPWLPIFEVYYIRLYPLSLVATMNFWLFPPVFC